MRACKQCGSVKVIKHSPPFPEKASFECGKCGHHSSAADFPHLHSQVDRHAFKSHVTTGPGSHRVNPTGSKNS